MNVQDISGAKNEDCGVGEANKVPSGITDVSTTDDTIILDLAKEQNDEDDDDFQAMAP
jgi:hypothetical protein